ncbi:MAG TPA: 3-dehydroquinate synthase, partial [Porphyromonadaceae bacterium]|nr:3-dehydroquinate synthase [Porphyromonadaceae bacterium]
MQQIIKSDNLTDDLGKAIKNISHDKLFVLTDENTLSKCYPLIEDSQGIQQSTLIVIPADDNNKTIENLSKVWKVLTEKGATRHSLLINLGGGMVTDLGGFAAA